MGSGNTLTDLENYIDALTPGDSNNASVVEFNFVPLSTTISFDYIFAAEERMYDAAAPSIAIVMIGLLPIIILTRMIRTSRPASRD